MRAWEIKSEGITPSKPITLKALHQAKWQSLPLMLATPEPDTSNKWQSASNFFIPIMTSCFIIKYCARFATPINARTNQINPL